MRPGNRARTRLVAAALLATAVALPAPPLRADTNSDASVPEWRDYAGGPDRTFLNGSEILVDHDSVRRLRERWRFPTGRIITTSVTVARVDLPDRGRTAVVYFLSWDLHLYAVRLDDGVEVWRFRTDQQPGAAFPMAATPVVVDVDGRPTVLVGGGETMYSVDAVTGTEVWRFVAGTGCRDANGDPPGLCGFGVGEQNEIESSATVVDGGVVVFGTDTNDDPPGKGGWYGIDLRDGRLRWFFDLQSGRTCVPFPGDDVRRYDGYHSEPDLGLEPGFLATRPGCDAPRDPTGCENVWSSAAWDPGRRLMYFASSNCDLDDDRSSLFGAAVMPPYDEAVVAMAPDGTPVWRWRPRDVDNADLAFGAVPNLFTIDVDGARVDVVGIGNKDGTYTVLDRDGRNERSGVNWDDPEAATQLPYWRTRVTEGGSIGGILATAAVDADARRIVFSTAPGFDPLAPQRPTVHALDMDTGAVAWDNAVYDGLGGDSSYGPTSAVAGVAFVGSTITSTLRAYDTTTGELLYVRPIGDRFLGGVASGAAVVDGIVVVGTGLGAMNGDHPYSDAELMARTPQSLVALCVTGVPGCPVVSPGAPSGVVAAASDAEPGAAAVTWVPPRDDGGSALVAQTVTATPGGAQVTVGGGTGSATVRGLEPGTSYVFTVTARNEIGAGITSAPSAATPVRVADPTSWCDGRAATIMGTAGPNLLHGTAGDDVIVAGGGSDTVLAGSGDDVVCGGDGYDILAGGDGVDVLAGGDGGDWLFGGAGDDVVNSGDGTDVVRGDTGDDSVDGGAGHDFVAGGAGDDMVNGRSGNDVLACDSGEDQVDGGPGFDPASGCELSWNLP